ncbi:MAG: hypothetical protein B5M51_06425 [Anaerolinea sp. 4484_236]|nr:MAG: hypothetical protein B5M51_06425 [Anaerolinea sp. 4484_236]
MELLSKTSNTYIAATIDRSWRILLAAFSGLLGLLAWFLVSTYGAMPSFILPTPGQVWVRFLKTLWDGSLLLHTGITLLEVLMGLTLGVSVAILDRADFIPLYCCQSIDSHCSHCSPFDHLDWAGDVVY